MKKYFVKETDEEVLFGDIINMNFSKELEDGRVTIEKEFKFSSSLVEALESLGLVEEKDCLIDFSDEKKDSELEEEDEEQDFYDLEEAIQDLIDDQEYLEEKIAAIENHIKTLESTVIKDLEALVKKEMSKNSSKKK